VQWRRVQSRYLMSALDIAWPRLPLGYGGSEVTGDGLLWLKWNFSARRHVSRQVNWYGRSFLGVGLYLESSPPTSLEALSAQSYTFTS
jgi:hypothetical protein